MNPIAPLGKAVRANEKERAMNEKFEEPTEALAETRATDEPFIDELSDEALDRTAMAEGFTGGVVCGTSQACR